VPGHKCRSLSFAKALETLLGLEPRIQCQLIGSVDVGLLHLWELCVVVKGAELMDFFIGSGSLRTKLVAGDVENLEATLVQFLMHLLERLVVRGESAARCSVDDDDDLAFEVRHLHFVAARIENAQIIKAHVMLRFVIPNITTTVYRIVSNVCRRSRMLAERFRPYLRTWYKVLCKYVVTASLPRESGVCAIERA